jgi:hypothetical protein
MYSIQVESSLSWTRPTGHYWQSCIGDGVAEEGAASVTDPPARPGDTAGRRRHDRRIAEKAQHRGGALLVHQHVALGERVCEFVDMADRGVWESSTAHEWQNLSR